VPKREIFQRGAEVLQEMSNDWKTPVAEIGDRNDSGYRANFYLSFSTLPSFYRYMKFFMPHCNHSIPLRPAAKRSGMALVLVLSAIVLLSVLILAFMSSAGVERVASGSQLNQTEARLLSENVLSLVTSQIRDASTGTNAWISQPGAIRTFTGSQQPDKVYKLYSAEEMVVPGSSFNPASLADVPTGGGALDNNMYTDLNSPVRVGSTWIYPILDPAALGVVEGFSANSTSVAKNTIAGNPVQIPMPVRWLYVLQDGTLQAMDASGKVTSASATNPIVGRVAFWTDDETCKLNINTASSGMYWDQPIGKGNQFEAGKFIKDPPIGSLPVVTRTGLASSPPGVREFQRYPGHPAMTSLDVVFNNNTFFSATTNNTDRVKKILELTPRANSGGSELGTKFPATKDATDIKPLIVTLDKDRLYATVDELFYKHSGNRTQMATNNGTATPAMNMTPANLSLARFFLTANSRAPEVTAFNTPRVAAWPVNFLSADRTVFDKTIAFCSTVNGTEYIFQRSPFDPSKIGMVANNSFTGASSCGSQNAILDFTAKNSKIYNYLKGLMAKSYPGFGASLASKFGSDSDQILTEIYDYIRCVNLFDCSEPTARPFTGRPFFSGEAMKLIPGFPHGGYASLQSGLPLPLSSHSSSYTPSAYMGQVVPAEIGTTRGFGRFPTIVGATLGFFATDPVTPKSPADFATMSIQLLGDPNPWNNNASRTATELTSWTANNTLKTEPAGKIRGILVFSVATPAAGPLTITHTYDIRVNSGLSSFRVGPSGNLQPINMPDGSINRILSIPHRFVAGSGLPIWEHLFIGGPLNINNTNRTYSTSQSESIYSMNQSPKYPNIRRSIKPTEANSASYPFVSQSDITVNTDPATPDNPLSFTGGTLDVDILVDKQVVQNVKMNFPDFTAPMPRWAPVYIGGNATSSAGYRFIDGKIIKIITGNSTTVTASGGSWGIQVATGSETSGNWTTTNNGSVDWSNRISTGIGEDSPMRWSASSPTNSGPINLPPTFMPNNLDTVRGIELNTSAPPYGDARLVAGLKDVPASYFQPCAGYGNTNLPQAHSLRLHPAATNGNLVAGVSTNSSIAASQLYGLPSTMTAATRSDGGPGDWDAGVARSDANSGFTEAGAFINKPTDAAFTFFTGEKPQLPYFEAGSQTVSTGNAFTPNRMMPSAGMFGSLPVGVKRGLPWQTLLFRPNFNASPTHPGAANPPDHLILDLFQMPVVEPYAISEPFSTAGKVNLNWQIAPFSYIKRSTALRGVLYPEKIIAVPTRNAYLFSLNPDGTTPIDPSNPSSNISPLYTTVLDNANSVFNYRYNIDRDATMTLFEKRFTDNAPFLTASQICEMPLVPKPENVSGSGLVPASRNPFSISSKPPLTANATASQVTTYVNDFWADTTLGGAGTADNLRERPYTTIYPRVTVKSNTYTVHLRVQSLKKRPGSDPQTFDQTKDTVTSEYRGSFLIERFLDPNASNFTITDANSTLGPYKFRVVNTKQFSP
jgi:uncharacterized protein (TIGR02600 family)